MSDSVDSLITRIGDLAQHMDYGRDWDWVEWAECCDCSGTMVGWGDDGDLCVGTPLVCSACGRVALLGADGSWLYCEFTKTSLHPEDLAVVLDEVEA